MYQILGNNIQNSEMKLMSNAASSFLMNAQTIDFIEWVSNLLSNDCTTKTGSEASCSKHSGTESHLRVRFMNNYIVCLVETLQAHITTQKLAGKRKMCSKHACGSW